ncbi:hypothetical protein [uncultured Thiodictyon sp.]|uniref:hypothetical protein n=1 Tax=uncultured Thiodictyon sp. TaxID=1846217 RepID=UPI0025D5025E|nr:hypothetical protein [uncultured Thiodictyon sp.]
MAKSDFVPKSDHDLVRWVAIFLAKLLLNVAGYRVTPEDVARVEAASADFDAKLAQANASAIAAKADTAAKNASRERLWAEIRALVRLIKAQYGYTQAQGTALGIEGTEHVVDLSVAKPVITGVDQTGGPIILSYVKGDSDEIAFYCKRPGDDDWVPLGRTHISPFIDDRPLLHAGTPELRIYTAVYLRKGVQVGLFSDDLEIVCAP